MLLEPVEVNFFEAALEREMMSRVLEYLLDSEVRGDDDAPRAVHGGSSFVLGREGSVVSPSFKVCGEAGVLFADVIDDDCLLVVVSIPPFVEMLVISVREELESLRGLTGAGGTIEPLVLKRGVGV